MDTFLNSMSDADLLSSCDDGDEAIFRELVNRYKDSLYRFLWYFLKHHDQVEDVFQEAFLRLYTYREQFDTSRPLKPWLFTIAANIARDTLRQSRRHPAVLIGNLTSLDGLSLESVLNTFASQDDNPCARLEQVEVSDEIRRIIADMPQKLRDILNLAYFDRFSYKQMAEILSIPLGTVKSRLHAAVACFMQSCIRYYSSSSTGVPPAEIQIRKC